MQIQIDKEAAFETLYRTGMKEMPKDWEKQREFYLYSLEDLQRLKKHWLQYEKNKDINCDEKDVRVPVISRRNKKYKDGIVVGFVYGEMIVGLEESIDYL